MDEKYMLLALSLAEKGIGYVNPNPLVGAVIVKENRIIGQGWHKSFGGPHAEREALIDTRESTQGATLYVTLEPCCHEGKTPPCTQAILESGISRVVVGTRDPNPLVCGKGIAILKQHGIQVTEGVLEEKCKRLNEVFFHYIQTKRPFVIMKYAMTLDGKIAAYTGLSKWITGEQAREHVQFSRRRYTAIMVGSNTIIKDNPSLTCRLENARNPVRILCDTRLRIPIKSKVVQTANEIPTYLATGCIDTAQLKPYQKAGCKILSLPTRDGHIDLMLLMQLLGESGIDSILLEGGGELNFSALQSGIVNRIQAYIAPKLLGGSDAVTAVEGKGIADPKDAFELEKLELTRLGADIMLEGNVKCSQG